MYLPWQLELQESSRPADELLQAPKNILPACEIKGEEIFDSLFGSAYLNKAVLKATGTKHLEFLPLTFTKIREGQRQGLEI